jgi:hypothetical protein
MAEDLDQLIQDAPGSCIADDRRENFRSAVFELKYNICHIEKKYPFLGTELSSMCEDTISRLSWPSPADILPVNNQPSSLPVLIENSAQPDSVPAGIPAPVEQSLPSAVEVSPHVTGSGNPVAYGLDAAGGVLVKGLDKMGDGIIIAFEKLLSLGPKSRKQPPVMEKPVEEAFNQM